MAEWRTKRHRRALSSIRRTRNSRLLIRGYVGPALLATTAQEGTVVRAASATRLVACRVWASTASFVADLRSVEVRDGYVALAGLEEALRLARCYLYAYS